MRYFKDSELECRCGCGTNTTSPELHDLIDAIRDEFGAALVCTSGQRCHEHNVRVGGAVDAKGNSTSLHVKGLAADLVPSNGDIKRLREVCLRLNPNGGVGASYATFVHVDVRGYAARW